MHDDENEIQFVRSAIPGRLTIEISRSLRRRAAPCFREAACRDQSRRARAHRRRARHGQDAAVPRARGLWPLGRWAASLSPTGEEVLYCRARPYCRPARCGRRWPIPAEVRTFDDRTGSPQRSVELGLERLSRRWIASRAGTANSAKTNSRPRVCPRAGPRAALDAHRRSARFLRRGHHRDVSRLSSPRILPRTGVINIGRPQLDPELFPRVVAPGQRSATRNFPRSDAAGYSPRPPGRPKRVRSEHKQREQSQQENQDQQTWTPAAEPRPSSPLPIYRTRTCSMLCSARPSASSGRAHIPSSGLAPDRVGLSRVCRRRSHRHRRVRLRGDGDHRGRRARLGPAGRSGRAHLSGCSTLSTARRVSMACFPIS